MTGNGSINPFPTGIDKGTVQWVNWLHFGTPWDPKNRDWPEVIILPLQLLPLASSTTLSFTLPASADPSKLGTAQWVQKLYCIVLHFFLLFVPKCSQLTHCTVPLPIPVGKGLMLPFPVTRSHIFHFSLEMVWVQFNPIDILISISKNLWTP